MAYLPDLKIDETKKKKIYGYRKVKKLVYEIVGTAYVPTLETDSNTGYQIPKYIEVTEKYLIKEVNPYLNDGFTKGKRYTPYDTSGTGEYMKVLLSDDNNKFRQVELYYFKLAGDILEDTEMENIDNVNRDLVDV